MLKHLLLNRMLAGKARLNPRFNEANNEDLLLSIQTAGVLNGKKDKSGEKLAETEEDLLEHRTDGSDAFDSLAIGCEIPRAELTAVGSAFSFDYGNELRRARDECLCIFRQFIL